MFIEYKNGDELLKENAQYFIENKYENAFILMDIPLLKEVDKENYSIKFIKDDEYLIIFKKVPYNTMFCGSPSLVKEMLDYIFLNKYEFNNFLANEEISSEVLSYMKKRGTEYKCILAMDYMFGKEKTIESDARVIKAKEEDIDEIFVNQIQFIKDCGLDDETDKESIIRLLDDWRLIKVDGVIVSQARLTSETDDSIKISCVYTKDTERGKGYAKALVNTMKNEILDRGYLATLFVDHYNPISNHVYSKIGFTKDFSYFNYRVKEK